MKFNYAGACFQIKPITTTAAAPHTDNISAGSVLLIL